MRKAELKKLILKEATRMSKNPTMDDLESLTIEVAHKVRFLREATSKIFKESAGTNPMELYGDIDNLNEELSRAVAVVKASIKGKV